MVARSELRKEAYRFILQNLDGLSSSIEKAQWEHCVSLEELRLMKEGMADPSPALVECVRSILGERVSEAAINSYLVNPFKINSSE